MPGLQEEQPYWWKLRVQFWCGEWKQVFLLQEQGKECKCNPEEHCRHGWIETYPNTGAKWKNKWGKENNRDINPGGVTVTRNTWLCFSSAHAAVLAPFSLRQTEIYWAEGVWAPFPHGLLLTSSLKNCKPSCLLEWLFLKITVSQKA